MPIEIRMPALSPTMTEGTLLAWKVAEGEHVEPGQVLAEIETDKATMELEADEEGTLARILIPEGSENIAVQTPIGILLMEGEDPEVLKDYVPEANSGNGVQVETPDKPAASPVQDESSGSDRSQTPVPSLTPEQPQTAGRVFASPLARRIAAEKGIDISTVTGSGSNGRIVKRDIEALGTAKPGGVRAASTPAAPAAPAAVTPAAPYEAVKLSAMRRTIAARLVESKQTIPHFYLNIEAEIDRLLEMRKSMNARLPDDKVSVNDFVIRAVALALKQVPAANVQFAGDHLYHFARADISVAVAIEGGLITPVVRDADAKSLVQISREMKDLAGRAKQRKLMPEEYQGGTFSISNLGMYGITEFSAVINPPQAAILAVGAGKPVAVVRDGELVAATVMKMTLSCDHRAIDGAIGAEFLAALKVLLEDPLALLL